MRPVLRKIKPANGFSYFLHLGLLIFLPAVIFVLIRLSFVQLALSVIVLSKWRMFAVRPRFWPANIRANGVDLLVGFSIVLFMNHTASLGVQLLFAVLYAIWLIGIKPASGLFMISLQAFIGQLSGLMALYLVWTDSPIYGLTFATGGICFLAARHFFDSFEEPYAKMLAYIWGYFGAALAWVLSHWLIFYAGVSQITLLLSLIGYGMAILYYLHHHDKLSKLIRKEVIFIMMAVILVVLVTTKSWWSNATV